MTQFIKQTNQHHKKDLLIKLKGAYDSDGMPGMGYLLKLIMNHEFDDNNRKIDFLELLMFLTYKIDTCEADCFENLKDKWLCRCECSGSLMEVHFFDEPEAST